MKHTEFLANVRLLFYYSAMSDDPSAYRAANSLRLRFGRRFEATATGWGVLVLPVAVGILLAAWWLFAG